MMDPGFAILNDLVAVREHIDKGRIDLAKVALKRATWSYLDRWCDEADRESQIDAADATADTSDVVYCAGCGVPELAPDVYAHTPSCVLANSTLSPKVKLADGVSRASEALPPEIVDHIERCGE